MIGATLQKVSRARSNKARLLALFLAISVIDGLYFPRELLIFGFALSFYVLASFSHRRSNFVTETSSAFGLTDSLLLGMFFFSMLGILHPIKMKDGLIEALRWGIFWFAYRLGVRISSNETEKQHLVQYIEWLAIVVALIGWLPYVSKVAGRLSSVFGYPNATAAFLGAVLLLNPHRKLVHIFLGISLLGTGSRAGVGLFLVVLMGQQLFLGVRPNRIRSFVSLRQRFQTKEKITSIHFRRLWVIILALVSTVLMFHYNRAVWDNLISMGSASSWQERLYYYKDGITLAWNAGGLPQAGGWMAFPTVQRFPYWTTDPHSSFIHILLNQGVLGISCMGIWISYCFAQAWKYWRNNGSPIKSRAEFEETKAQVRVWGTLLFLGLHSLVDADFSFAALGFLFWLLYGSIQKKEDRNRPFSSKHKLTANLSSKGVLVLSLILCLFSGSALLNPNLLDKEGSWNTQAIQGREQDPVKSNALWVMSLNWDQTQVGTRREQAELLLRGGNEDSGLKAVEEVINWQPFDLEAYEWAQSIVWDTAEVQRRIHPEKAAILYGWIERVPLRIEERVAILTPTERLLWQGYQDFTPSEHIKLLAEYARQR